MDDYKEQFDAAPVDSSSPDFEPQELGEITVSEDGDGVMLYNAGAEGLLDSLKDILEFSKFATTHTNLTRRLVAAGAPADAATVEVQIDALEAQALSVGLNLVGFFVPELGDVSEALLRRVAEKRAAWKPTDEQQALYDAARDQVADEDAARLFGFDSVEAFQEARAQAIKDADEGEIQVDVGGEPHLN